MTGYNPPPGYPPGYYPPQPAAPAQPAPYTPHAPPVAPVGPPPGYGYPPQGMPPAAPQAPFQAAYGAPGAPTSYGPPAQPQAPYGAPYGAPPGYPAAPPGYGAPPSPYGAPPMPPMAAPPPAPVGPPAYHMPTAEEVAGYLAAAQQREAEAQQRRGQKSDRPKDFKFPTPDGGTKWNASHAGKEVSVFVRLMPSTKGAPYFVGGKHFFPQTDNPKMFHSGWCLGSNCPVCAEVEAMIGSPIEAIRDKGFRARAKNTNLWSLIAWSDNPVVQRTLEEMQIVGGRFVGLPMLWEVPNEVHKQILELFGARGPHTYLDLARGAPIRVTKKRTGKKDTEVEYRVIDMLTQAGPLPYGIGPNGEGLALLDIASWGRPMKIERASELTDALQKYARTIGAEAGRPAPQTHAYAPQAAPPTPSPWQQPQAPAQPPAPPPSAWQPGQQLPNVGAPPPTWGAAPSPAPQAPAQPAAPTWGAQPEAPPPALPAGDPGAASGFPGPRTSPPSADPWGAQALEQPAWTPPAPPAAPAWGAPVAAQPAPGPAPSGIPPELLALQQQMTGAAPIPAPAQGGMGPAFPAPPVGAPPPR